MPRLQVFVERAPISLCAPTKNTIILEKIKTTIVLIAVATLESVFRIPHFANIEVSPANSADANANTIHIIFSPPLFLC